MISQILLSLGLVYLAWSYIAMEINHRRASAMGIPLVRLFIDPLNIPWIIFEPTVWRLLDLLPFRWGTFEHYSRRGWHFHDKAKSHVRYGPIWALVTPRDIYVYVADPDAIREIFDRRGDFLRPSKMYKMLEVYGPCISTASWKEWPRHRKVLATPFNENIMKFVWDESIKQTVGMIQTWQEAGEPHIPSIAKDTRTLSLNVLAATGFQRSYAFRASSQIARDEASSYRNALQTVLDNALLLMLVPPRLLRLPLLPRSLTHIGRAAIEFKQYMIQMLDQETSFRDQGKSGSGSLMTSFVRALDTHQQSEIVASIGNTQPSKGLTVNEIFGNIFVINFAGHDTTANTLAFAMLLLAAHPEIQEWVAQEVQALVNEGGEGKWDYGESFADLKRCRSVLLETLRLYPPILALPKWTDENPQSLKIGTKTIIVPPFTGVMPSLLAVQTHPQYWQNPLLWQPSRWISESPTSGSTSVPVDSHIRSCFRREELVIPRENTYFPWSSGPQNCPGAKFAQVEFVAVLACFLREHRMEVILEPNESITQAKKRVLAVTEDCDLGLLLRMRDADKVRLACRKA